MTNTTASTATPTASTTARPSSTAPPSTGATSTPTSVGAAPSRAALPVLMIGTFLVVLDFFAVNVALPQMQADLGATTSQIEWVVAGYGLTLAALLITGSRIADRIGRRRTFAIGLLTFAAASLACGAAPSAGPLIAGRLCQGAAAALLTPSVLSILGASYVGQARLRALSVYGAVMGVAAAGGQLIGGVLIELNVLDLGWRAVFLINVPLGVLGAALAPRVVPESRGGATRFDVVGVALISVALAAVVLPLIEGRSHGWPLWTWLSFLLGAGLVVAFALQQRAAVRRGRMPLFDPILFRRRSIATGLALQLTLWCGQASYFLVLALYLQQGRGLAPLDAGLVFSIMAATYLVASLRAPGLTARYGRRVLIIGAALLAVGHLVLLEAVVAGGLDGSIAQLAPGLAIAGAGMGLCISPLVTIVLSSVAPADAGAVSGALSTAQQMGNCLGVAAISAVFFGVLPHGFDEAFGATLAILAALLAAVSCAATLLPRRSS